MIEKRFICAKRDLRMMVPSTVCDTMMDKSMKVANMSMTMAMDCSSGHLKLTDMNESMMMAQQQLVQQLQSNDVYVILAVTNAIKHEIKTFSSV